MFMRYIIVFIALFFLLSPEVSTNLQAQQTTVESRDPNLLNDEAQANEQAGINEAETAQTSSNDDMDSSGGSSTSDNRSGDFDVFKPSEDISEDLAVPFPVDI